VDGHDFSWDLIRAVWKSVAVFAINPKQGVLGLGGGARMKDDDPREDLAAGLRDLNWMMLR
jgi:hypothetical protein